MQTNKFRNCLQMLFISLVTAFVTSGCTKEDLSLCANNTSHKLTIRAYDAQRVELTGETVKDVALYVFDKDKQFLGLHTDIQLGQSVELNYPGHDNLAVVAWGNARQGRQTLPTLKVGDKMAQAFVSLLKTKASMATIQSPDDIFYGSVALSSENIDLEQELPLYRKTSGVSITARQLKKYANASDDNFTYVLRQTGDQLNFEGNEVGDFSAYIPQASFDNNQDFVAPIFNILTTSSNIEVDIFHGDILVATIVQSPDGQVLRVEAGKTLNILVDFQSNTDDASMSVSVKFTAWGVQQIWREFN